jgi:hypothetical protein
VSTAETRSYAERFSWNEVIGRQVALYQRVLASSVPSTASAAFTG